MQASMLREGLTLNGGFDIPREAWFETASCADILQCCYHAWSLRLQAALPFTELLSGLLDVLAVTVAPCDKL